MADPHDVIARALIESQVRNRDDARFAAHVVLRALRHEFGCRSCDTFGTWHDRIVIPVPAAAEETPHA